ncbi:MAG: PfaD family polyunsaturated fatty acid/polyketide biosynthesis protein [Anaerolineae bacterium]|nr:PfaD family polyunsaturated fatty acid/polyketide biosynthesis protein [Anaerolineae bacterium]
MMSNKNGLNFLGTDHSRLTWQGPVEAIVFDSAAFKDILLNLSQLCFVVKSGNQMGLTTAGRLCTDDIDTTDAVDVLAIVPPLTPNQLGDAAFCTHHGVKMAYSSGAMANGIASEEVVISMGQAQLLASFGAAGLPPARLKAAIERIKSALPHGPYAFNLIHSPSEEALEQNAVEMYLDHGISTIEASAFLDLTPHVVRYRAAGLALNAHNEIEINHKIIAKLSRREVATKFMEPAPAKILGPLVQQGLITELQANLAQKVSMADDITVEADSGGHTDNQPLVGLLPAILALRDEIQAKYNYPNPIRVGAAGGISTPASALGAFMMGAAYVVSGSVNQSCLEANASPHTKNLLAQADMADVIMAPAADMFEMGVKVQVLKRGTLFPMRAQKLFDIYKSCDSIEDIPATERDKLEKQIFKRSLESVWNDTVAYFNERDPDQISRAANNSKRKMALIFRWYLGLSSNWSNTGEAGREIDYQIWCGPSMGAFNAWVKGTYLEDASQRRVVDVAHHIMTGAAYLYRLNTLKVLGIEIPASIWRYEPTPFEQPSSTVEPTLPLTKTPQPQELATKVIEPMAATSKSIKRVEEIQDWLVEHLADRLKVSIDEIDIREPFSSYDLSSAQVLVLAGKLEEWLECQLSPTLLWNYPTIEALADRLAEETDFSKLAVEAGTNEGA